MEDGLRHFLLIVDFGTFTEAARRAHLSQPALTASIQRLEQRLGAPLLERGRRGARPTAAGEALLPHARAVVAAIDDAARVVAEVQGLDRGEVRIGAGATACTYLLPPTLAAFRRDHPNIRFLLRECTTDEALEALADGALDLAVVSAVSGREAAGFITEPWLDDDLVLVAAPEFDPSPRWADVPFVTFRQGATTRGLVEKHFPEARIVMELGSIAAVKGNVRAGIGVALVSRAAIAHDLPMRRLVEVPSDRTPVTRRLSLVHRGARRLAPAAAALRQRLLDA